MNSFITNTIRFVLLALAQGLILNNVELGWGSHAMVYPLFIMLLPMQMTPVYLMLVSCLFGFSVDMISNTFGLHASAATVFAFFRPRFFAIIESRDNFESAESANYYAIGGGNFLLIYGSLLLIHHTWFSILESFKWNDFLIILRKVVLSVPLSYVLSLLIQFIFVSRKKVDR